MIKVILSTGSLRFAAALVMAASGSPVLADNATSRYLRFDGDGIVLATIAGKGVAKGAFNRSRQKSAKYAFERAAKAERIDGTKKSATETKKTETTKSESTKPPEVKPPQRPVEHPKTPVDPPKKEFKPPYKFTPGGT